MRKRSNYFWRIYCWLYLFDLKDGGLENKLKKWDNIYFPSESYNKVRIYGIAFRISEIQSPVMATYFI